MIVLGSTQFDELADYKAIFTKLVNMFFIGITQKGVLHLCFTTVDARGNNSKIIFLYILVNILVNTPRLLEIWNPYLKVYVVRYCVVPIPPVIHVSYMLLFRVVENKAT